MYHFYKRVKSVIGFCIFLPLCLQAQENGGRVVDSNGIAVSGCNVLFYNVSKDETQKTFSDKNGQFSIKAKEEMVYRLTISFLGFKTYDSILVVKDKEYFQLTVRLEDAVADIAAMMILIPSRFSVFSIEEELVPRH